MLQITADFVENYNFIFSLVYCSFNSLFALFVFVTALLWDKIERDADLVHPSEPSESAPINENYYLSGLSHTEEQLRIRFKPNSNDAKLVHPKDDDRLEALNQTAVDEKLSVAVPVPIEDKVMKSIEKYLVEHQPEISESDANDHLLTDTEPDQSHTTKQKRKKKKAVTRVEAIPETDKPAPSDERAVSNQNENNFVKAENTPVSANRESESNNDELTKDIKKNSIVKPNEKRRKKNKGEASVSQSHDDSQPDPIDESTNTPDPTPSIMT
jgi:hypothetical protein